MLIGKYENLITNTQGILTVNDLLPEKYKLVETQAPEGYYLSKDGVVEFEIALDNEGHIVDQEKLELLNQKLAAVKIIKQDAADSEIALQGTVFTLYQGYSIGASSETYFEIRQSDRIDPIEIIVANYKICRSRMPSEGGKPHQKVNRNRPERQGLLPETIYHLQSKSYEEIKRYFEACP